MAKNIMFQGTGSTVGKSVITAAICRVFNDEGYKVAPFKSQNMALNSFVTVNGKEMGRAQVVQAEAARVEPMVEMNPVLLKPTSDMGSQVVVNGQVFKNLSASKYYDHKRYLMDEVRKSYDVLDEAFDVIIIEGAGSPAEINLRKNDIVNMGLAEEVDSPVILIGDIDKGGVFASIYGTYKLLSESEQNRIKGYVINKFRGDVKLLEPGIEMFKEHLPIPCLGVVPWSDIRVDDEDSVTDRFTKKEEAPIQIGVVRLPYLSNFTDFTVLDLEEDVSVRYILDPEEFEEVDMVVIPGSKSTIRDLEYLKEKSVDQSILRAMKQGKYIMGICGGYQMMGTKVSDPYEVETDAGHINGLGLLNIETVMAKEKHTVQSEGKVITTPAGVDADSLNVKGYEIHMGETSLADDVKPFIELSDGELDGAISENGKVFGSYLHGIFDHQSFRQGLLGKLRADKGISDTESKDYEALKEAAYNDLAQLARDHMDIKKLKEIAGLL